MPQILVLAGWDAFQHYKDRDPTWVKLYRDLLTSESWVLGTDSSRLVQVASILLAARYQNATPHKYDLFRKVASLDVTASQFRDAISHLSETGFLEIQGDTESCEQPASTVLAKCSSEKRREEKRREEKNKTYVPQERDDGAVERIFDHWRTTHGHPRSSLDAKRRKVIRDRLKDYAEADLCQSISGYLNSPHHMGQNEKATKYDDLEIFLRDAKHVDAGIRFASEPPRTDLSSTTRRNVAAIADWVPPEARNATG